MDKHILLASAAGIALVGLLVYAAQTQQDKQETDQQAFSTTESPQTVAGWDDIEDGMEDIGGAIERQWERAEDAVIPETEEERREEAQERREDAAEEAAEERQER